MERYQFAAYSWAEVHEMNREKTIILIPLGSTEQEGIHLPLGVDTYVAGTIAQRIAKETGSLVGPALPVGYSEWFLEFPGTISLTMETLIQVLKEYISSLIRHGFKKFIFINSHVGNSSAVDVVSREFIMNHEVQIAMVEIWKVANSLAKDIPEFEENVFKHAGEIMTSVILYLHPDTVNMKKAKVEYLKSNKHPFKVKSSLGAAEFKGMDITLYDKAKNLTESGIMGDPLSATAEKGKVIINAITSHLVEMVKNF
jgi:creatinine amidohydrolase